MAKGNIVRKHIARLLERMQRNTFVTSRRTGLAPRASTTGKFTYHVTRPSTVRTNVGRQYITAKPTRVCKMRNSN